MPAATSWKVVGDSGVLEPNCGVTEVGDGDCSPGSTETIPEGQPDPWAA